MKRSDEATKVTFTLDQNDVESAVRQFICACYPDISTGFVVNPVGGMPTMSVEFEAVNS